MRLMVLTLPLDQVGHVLRILGSFSAAKVGGGRAGGLNFMRPEPKSFTLTVGRRYLRLHQLWLEPEDSSYS
jgi:hypothetical protein